MKFASMCPIENSPALVQVMAWRRTGDKPLPEPTLTQFTDAYSALWGDEFTGSILFQLNDWHLFGTKPLPGPLLAYCQREPQK